jgi:hypothetical protein
MQWWRVETPRSDGPQTQAPRRAAQSLNRAVMQASCACRSLVLPVRPAAACGPLLRAGARAACAAGCTAARPRGCCSTCATTGGAATWGARTAATGFTTWSTSRAALGTSGARAEGRGWLRGDRLLDECVRHWLTNRRQTACADGAGRGATRARWRRGGACGEGRAPRGSSAAPLAPAALLTPHQALCTCSDDPCACRCSPPPSPGAMTRSAGVTDRSACRCHWTSGSATARRR